NQLTFVPEREPVLDAVGGCHPRRAPPRFVAGVVGPMWLTQCGRPDAVGAAYVRDRDARAGLSAAGVCCAGVTGRGRHGGYGHGPKTSDRTGAPALDDHPNLVPRGVMPGTKESTCSTMTIP